MVHQKRDMVEASLLSRFSEITKAVSTAPDVNSATQALVERISAGFAVDLVTVHILDDNGQLSLRASSDPSFEWSTQALQVSDTAIAKALGGEPVYAREFSSVEDSPFLFYLKSLGFSGALCLPIVSRGQTFGVLSLVFKKYPHISMMEYQFLVGVSEQSGILIENSCMYRRLANQLRFLGTLNDIAKSLASSTKLQDVLNLITYKMTTIMDLKGCTIRLINPEKKRLELVASYGLSDGYLRRGNVDEEIAMHQALKAKKPVFVYDAKTDPRICYHDEASNERISSILAIPIMSDKQMLGVLRLLTETPRVFSESEVDFALAVAEHGAIAMKKAQHYERMTKLLQEIEAQENFLANILDNLDAGLVVLDNVGRIVMSNSVFQKWLDKDAEGLTGRHAEVAITFWHLLDLQWKADGNQKITPDYNRLIMFEKENKAQIYLEAAISPVFNADEAIELTICLFRDVTDTKLLEKEQLEKERLEGVLDLARTAAHEINTPVFVAIGSCDLAMEDIPEDNSAIEELKNVRKNLKKIASLIQQMNLITKYKSKNYAGDVTILDLDGSAVEKGER